MCRLRRIENGSESSLDWMWATKEWAHLDCQPRRARKTKKDRRRSTASCDRGTAWRCSTGSGSTASPPGRPPRTLCIKEWDFKRGLSTAQACNKNFQKLTAQVAAPVYLVPRGVPPSPPPVRTERPPLVPPELLLPREELQRELVNIKHVDHPPVPQQLLR